MNSDSAAGTKRGHDNTTTAPGDDHDSQHNGTTTNGLNGQHTKALDQAAEAQRSDGGSNTPSGPPAKRRKIELNGSISASALRPPSPPWKKFSVEGPTSFVDKEGRRKSSRVNVPAQEPIPTEPEGGTQRTRTSRGQGKPRLSYADMHNGKESAKTPVQAAAKEGRPASSVKASAQPHFKVPPKKTSRKSDAPSEPRPRSSSSARRRHSTNEATMAPQPKEHPSTPDAKIKRRSSRIVEAEAADHEKTQINGWHGEVNSVGQVTPLSNQRLKLKFREPGLLRVHPAQFPAPRKHASFQEWLQQDDPLEDDEDTTRLITDEQVRREATVRLRLIKEAEPGGALSEERCSVYGIERAEEPAKSFANWNHAIAHARNFRRLLREERDRHRKAAKLTAQACKDKLATDDRFAKCRLPMDEDERFKLEQKYAIIRHKQLFKDMEKMWDLVREEVNKIRRAKYEEEQQAAGKRALDDMLDHSTQLLNQRRARLSSELLTEDGDEEYWSEDDAFGEDAERLAEGEQDDMQGREGDLDHGSDSDSQGEGLGESDPDVMSEDEDDEDERPTDPYDEDEGLDQEALRQKYADALQVQDESEDDRMESDEEETDNEVPAHSIRHRSLSAVAGAERDHSREQNDPELVLSQSPPNRTQPGQLPSPSSRDHASGDHAGLHGVIPQDVAPEDDIDPILLEDSDHSTDMDNDMGSTDGSAVASESKSDEDENEGQSEDEEEDNPLWGFMTKASREEIKKEAAQLLAKEEPTKPPRRSPDSVIPDSTATQSRINTPDVATESFDSILPMGTTNHVKSHSRVASVSTPVSNVEVTVHPTHQRSVSRHSSVLQSGAMTPATPKSTHIEVPPLFRGTLREYQHAGLEWLAKLYSSATNGILADEMGLGKTIQTIVLLAHLAVHHEIWGPHLVVVPSAVMYNWEMEFKRFCPGFKVLVYDGDIEERKRRRKGWKDDDLWNVVITSYALVVQDAQAFKMRSWHYLILDEAHALKNFQTKRWQTMLNFKTNARLLLTGTPLQNNLQELWSLLYFLMPSGSDGHGGFSDLDKFINAVRRPADQILDKGMQKLDAQGQEAVDKLHEVLRPYLLRRLKADVEKQMPGKYEHVVYCRLSKRQRQLYDEFLGRADTKASFSGGNYISIMACLQSLRKVCSHPDMFETRPIKTSFALPKSAVADFEIKEFFVRKRLYEDTVDLDHIGLLLSANERHSIGHANRWRSLEPTRLLEDIVTRQSQRIPSSDSFDLSTLQGALSCAAAEAKRDGLDRLRHCILRCKKWSQRRPIYGTGLHKRVSLGFQERPFPRMSREIELIPPPPPLFAMRHTATSSTTATAPSPTSSNLKIAGLISPVSQRAVSLQPTLEKFASVTPAVIASDILPLTLTPTGLATLQRAKALYPTDPFHEARIRLSIAFPDKRLLQWDCGKLQKLDRLLRDLQVGGHRALIFSGMTLTLNILEQFLNIHGHRYLRLDGSTKPQMRQDMVDRFNNDPKIPVFILSTRAGGLGINLTGADTVIFYDMDWNPAWDKQCQDRAHRIGQTRDVHIYRMVSEATIEANILRKSNQKRLLDEVIIQKGDFTTEGFNKVTYKDALDDAHLAVQEDEAGAAMDRLFGDDNKALGGALEAVEDKEDVAAAKAAMAEELEVEAKDAEAVATLTEDGDLADGSLKNVGAGGDEARRHIDEYMLAFVQRELMHVPLGPPPDRKRNRKGKDMRRR